MSSLRRAMSTPPIVSPCFLGVDMATKAELIAANKTVEEIRQHIGADSLGYLSLEGMVRATGGEKSEYCAACFTGEYLVPVQLELDKGALEMPARTRLPIAEPR